MGVNTDMRLLTSEVFCPFIKKEKQFYSKMPPLREDSGLPIIKTAFLLLKSPNVQVFHPWTTALLFSVAMAAQASVCCP